jgi:hypothetical protein
MEDLIHLRKKKDGGVSLKDALFKAANNNTDSEMTNLSTKTNKITEMLKNKGVNQDEEEEDFNQKKGVDSDGIYLEDTRDPLYEESQQNKSGLLGKDRRPSDAAVKMDQQVELKSLGSNKYKENGEEDSDAKDMH